MAATNSHLHNMDDASHGSDSTPIFIPMNRGEGSH